MRWLCVLFFFAASPALADDGSSVQFDAMDLDGDGYVSLAEAAGNADVVTKFDKADRNRDGRLSPKEFARLPKIKLHVAKTRRERMRTGVARDVRAAEREAAAETAPLPVAGSAPSAAAGGSARRPASP
jgi:hypothetical protein